MSAIGTFADLFGTGGQDGTSARGTALISDGLHFNVAGAIFEQLSGKTVFRAMAEDLALPLQFEDFDPARQHMLGYQSDPSRYKAYHMFLSGRDMARLGVVMLNA